MRLADAGADAVPTFLYLIDDAQRFRKEGGNDWQHPTLAGLIGICRLGAEGGPAREPLLARLDGGQLPIHGSYGQLVFGTLLAIGVDTETIWQRFQAADANADRKRFDRMVRRAAGPDGPDCSY